MNTLIQNKPDLNGTDICVAIPDDFRLDSGQTLAQKSVTARLYGPPMAPLVIAAGGISAGRILLAKEDTSETAPGWWEGVAGPGHALDLNQWRVLSIEFAPEQPTSKVFTISTHDQARLVRLLVDHLKITHVHGFVGASYGAMIGLAFAELYPEDIDRLCIISAAHRAHPMATAMRGLQRRILHLGQISGFESEAVSLARQLAMTTYRSSEEFSERFDGPSPQEAGGDYVVCGYLRSRGDAYQRDANRWIALSDSLDRHRVDPIKIKALTTLAAVPTDRLVPYEDMVYLHNHLNQSVLVDLVSLYGHDAFLKEIEQVSAIVRQALE